MIQARLMIHSFRPTQIRTDNMEQCRMCHDDKRRKTKRRIIDMKAIGILLVLCVQSSSAFQAPHAISSYIASSRKISTSRRASNEEEPIVGTVSPESSSTNDDSGTRTLASSPAPSTQPQEFQQVPPPPPVSVDQMMAALGTNPRRILLGNLSAAGIALAGNFLGVTSKLLTAVPEDVVEKTSLDTYFPRVSQLLSYCISRLYSLDWFWRCSH